MSEYILQAKNITKTFKNDKALDNVSMSLKKGEIYGFIGQNGAGKSTMLRIITGLSFPTNGQLELFDSRQESNIVEAQKRMGAIIENPGLFPNMSAYNNLEVHRLQKGIPGRECIDRTLELVGLQDTAKKKVKNFSL